MLIYREILKILRLVCLFLLPIGIMLHEMNFTNGILYLAFFICALNFRSDRERWQRFDCKFLFLIICFCFGLIASNYYSIDTSVSMKWARRYCYWILPGLAVYGLWMKDKLGRQAFVNGLAVGGMILCLYAGYQEIILDMKRPGSLSTGPNSFSAIVALALSFVLLNNKNILVGLISWGVFLWGVVISQSRGSFLALTFVSVIYCFNDLTMKVKFTWKKIVGVILVTGVLVSGLSAINNDKNFDFGIWQRLSNTNKMGGDNERIYLWRSSLAMIKDFPIHGVGLRQFNSVYINGNYINPQAREPRLDSPHNIILHYMTEMGMVGTLPLIILFVYIIYWSIQNRRNPMAKAMLYAMVALSINNMVDYQFIVKQYYQLFWALLGGSIADVYLTKEKLTRD
ncbi:O-antigen ligase [uncultured Phascolarctobacterium sp.]|uniref:O-antigen ligase family protein n=1 Tax=uncultured Phascolarctobacterium sp. TaxID=512296 RepID=UPI00265CD5C7|nr:O-antigen ligase family protein [uncultured Phascolarctobacterium sp.]